MSLAGGCRRRRLDRRTWALIQHIAQTAERGKFDLIFLADAVNTSPKMHPSMVVRFEPLTLLAALAMTTTRVGLGATASTTYTEPYNLARAFASIDHLSSGRAAWNVVTGAFAEAAANFGRESHPPHEERYAAAAEFVSVMKGLWDSWEDGALVMDKASGTFIDPSKMHTLDHQGKFFRVKGPLNHTRPPQGYPGIHSGWRIGHGARSCRINRRSRFHGSTGLGSCQSICLGSAHSRRKIRTEPGAFENPARIMPDRRCI